MKIYFAGVGVAIGPLAMIARDMGHDVVCSDAVETDVVEYMREHGFTVHIGQDGSDLQAEHDAQPIDWFVHSSALPADNGELKQAKQLDIETHKRDSLINVLLEEKQLKMIAVAGTHGKTNTTAMLAWALLQSNIPISYSIGTTLPFGPFGKYQEGSAYFIYEADEFDRNFLNYRPALSLVTTIDFDHPDTYASQADYDMAFAQFIAQSEQVYMYTDSLDGELQNVRLLNKDPEESTVQMAGLEIRQNARLVLELLTNEFGVPETDAINHLNSFPGTSRRMEQLEPNLYTDYAHHPDEIRVTLGAASELSDAVVAIYQPHQNIRQHEILESYGDSFSDAKKVYWLPTYLSREDPNLDVLTPEQLIEGLSDPTIAEAAELNDELATSIRAHIADGSLVVGMSAGDLDRWLRQNFKQ